MEATLTSVFVRIVMGIQTQLGVLRSSDDERGLASRRSPDSRVPLSPPHAWLGIQLSGGPMFPDRVHRAVLVLLLVNGMR